MQASRLNEWLNLGASVGVLVGLLVVAYEVRQSGQATFAEMRSNVLSASNEVSVTAYGPEINSLFIKAIEQPDQLSDEEILKVVSFVSAFMNNIHMSAFLYYEFGWAGDPTESIHQLGKTFFNSSFTRSWFEIHRHWLHPKIAEIVQYEIDSNPVDNRPLYVHSFREKMAEINAAAN